MLMPHIAWNVFPVHPGLPLISKSTKDFLSFSGFNAHNPDMLAIIKNFKKCLTELPFLF